MDSSEARRRSRLRRTQLKSFRGTVFENIILLRKNTTEAIEDIKRIYKHVNICYNESQLTGETEVIRMNYNLADIYRESAYTFCQEVNYYVGYFIGENEVEREVIADLIKLREELIVIMCKMDDTISDIIDPISPKTSSASPLSPTAS